jgi:N-acetylneuraminic acid mutarotase
MKKQINPTIKAHLIRSACYVLLLLAVCVIPFALAQRNTKRNAAKLYMTATAMARQAAQVPKRSAPVSNSRQRPAVSQTNGQLRHTAGFVETGGQTKSELPAPNYPAVVLYDQYDNATGTAFESNFHADAPDFVDYMADDFVVPGGETWTITEVDVMGIQFGVGGATFNVAFYTNGAGNLPDTLVYSTNNGTYTTNGTDWVITIPPAILTTGTYWVMVQGNGSNNPFNSWFWTGRSVQSNDTAAWQQPGNAYGRNCITWQRKPICFSEVPNDPDQVFRLVGTMGGGGTPTPTPTATPGGCQFHVLIVYSDTGQPTQLQSEILAEPNVVACDLFDAQFNTPTLAQLQPYDIVVPFSNFPFADPVTLGNNLADYVDGGGVVVQHGFAFYQPGGSGYDIEGRWLADGYNPYDYSADLSANVFSLGAFNAGHPLMAGVTALNSNFQNLVTLAAGATEVAATNLNTSLVAFRPVSGGHTTVGVTAYVGTEAAQSGDWGKVIVNAGNWLRNCGGPCTLGPWNIIANYPEVLESTAVSSDGTFAYSAGGDTGFVGTTGVYRYDPVANTWDTMASLPQPLFDARAAFAANVNKVYVFGGIDNNFNVLNTTYIYDIGTNTWTPGAAMPGPRFFPAVAYYGDNGKIYVIGGIDNSFAEANQTWEYDPVADTWDTSRANIPVAMGGSATSIVGQNIYLAGSFGGGATDLHYSYDIVADSWTQKANVPSPVYEAAGAAIGTNTYVVGGGDPSVGPKATEQARIVAMVKAPATSFNTTYIYDTLTDTWTTGPNTNVPHSFTGGTAIGNELLVVCGFDGVNGDTNTVEKSDCGAGGATPTPTPTATATATATATPTATATATATPTATRPPPTPRPRPTPFPRPTP